MIPALPCCTAALLLLAAAAARHLTAQSAAAGTRPQVPDPAAVVGVSSCCGCCWYLP
jgi:hypothetical protein